MKRAMVACLLLAAALAGTTGIGRSGADFTDASTGQSSAFSTSSDFNTVAVTLEDLGPFARGTVTLDATATSERGIADVRFEMSPAGANTWTQMCVDTAAPYTCGGDSSGIPDGAYDIRVTATDAAGYWRRATDTAVLDNTAPSASLANPGTFIGTSTVLTATGADALSGLASLAVQYRPAGGSWSDACTGSTSPRACTLPAMADGDVELRARSEDAAGNVTTSTPITRRVDRNAPTVTVTDPGAMRGSFALAATTDDGGGTGVTSVRYQRSPAGANSWTDICTGSTAPFGCSWNTTLVSDGLYDLRAIATDGAELTTTSAVVASRRVDNSLPSTPTLAAIATPARGTLPLSGTASDSGSGIASWTVQYRQGFGAWTDACTDTTSSYSCSWDSTSVADGSYEFRAVATDAAGNTRTSATQTARVIDNTAPTAADVQTNTGGNGRLASGDWLRLTWSEQIAPTSVLTGWTGNSQSITVRVTNGSTDSMEFWNQANTTRLNLGTVALNANFVPSAGAVFNATIQQSTAQITITLGSLRSGSVNGGAASSANMVWTPSASATDVAGNPAATTPRTETGTADRDF
jgi:hypothetical protein